MNRKSSISNYIVIIVSFLFLVGAMYIGSALLFNEQTEDIDTSVGLKLLEDKKADQVKIVDGEQLVVLTLKTDYKDKGKSVQFYYVEPQGPAVVKAVEDAKPSKGYTSEVPQSSIWVTMLATFLPILLIVGVFWFFMSRLGGNAKAMSFGKSKAKLANKETPQVRFSDVAGVDEAVEEIEEVKEFLQDPERFQAVGAKIPRGVLLYGPPGTGKTLLARAVAGEAGVPFFSISGSDFVEMFVGVGASRVRDLFEQAKTNAPAIIFVDEIDAVGRHRGAGLGGGHDEREQTLNQLLVEMDGFDVKTNVILIAATNRPDILDPALLRPGRFDRQIAVDAPDMRGRQKILEVHAKGKPMADDVDLALVSRRTPGFTGADLANVLNEAALLTARQREQSIGSGTLDEAIDRVIAGPQRRTRLMNEAEKKLTAYHESGHALVAAGLRYTDPVTKVTILPRGQALGYTMVMPTEDRYSMTRNQMLDQLAYGLGGFAAEALVFHDPSSGAGSDIDKATALARKMVTQYGMSERVGTVKLGSSGGEVFLGREMGHERDYSEASAGVVDEEVRRMVDAALDEAWAILESNREVLDDLVLRLLEKETLVQDELKEVFEPVQQLDKRKAWMTGPSRVPSQIPPVKTKAEIEAGDDKSPEEEAASAHPEPAGGIIVETPEGIDPERPTDV